MLPAISQLEATPEIFRLLFENLTEDEARWKPTPDRWSLAEMMEHLSHVEAHGFRSRIDQMTGEDLPELREYDQEAHSRGGQYSGRNFEDSFDHWEDQREANLEILHDLRPDSFARKGRHEKFGIITVSELIEEWAFHDLGHVKQAVELIRSQRYFPKMGPFQSIYQIKP